MELKEALKKARLNHNYTQKQIAEFLEITEVSYCRYETDKRIPSIFVLMKLADFYNISLDELVGRKFPK